jgi:hypothetical protein
MRRRAKIDANQPAIVKELREAGYSVHSIAQMGKGLPDLLVGKNKLNWLFEIKDPNQKPSQRKLTEDERAWHAAWTGQINVIETAREALNIMESAVTFERERFR